MKPPWKGSDARIWRPARRLVGVGRRAAVRRRRAYGLTPPSWWPRRLDGWLGPRSPHENSSVTLFAGSRRYEFQPAVLGEHHGHIYPGELRPDAAELEERLERLGDPTDPARALATISSFEGGFDTLQTFDRGKLSWGFIQFTANGGLPALLAHLKQAEPATFAECFAAAGLDVDSGGRVTLSEGDRLLTGRAASNRLHDEPSLWRCFLLASEHDRVRDAQVHIAYERFYHHPLQALIPLGDGGVQLGELFAEDEYGRGVVCDRSISTGVGRAVALFAEAFAGERCSRRGRRRAHPRLGAQGRGGRGAALRGPRARAQTAGDGSSSRRPPRSRMMRSACAAARSSWVTMMTVGPPARPRRFSSSSSVPWGSR